MRKDRKPRNTPLPIHTRSDDWFYSRFGTRYRSQALFVTSRLSTASCYATYETINASPAVAVVRVIPLGPYTFCWSPKVNDLVSIVTDASAVDRVEDYLDAATYQEADLKGAFDSGNEVMLACEEYVTIPYHLLKSTTTSSPAPLIILG
jgi:hypothetical protein